MIKAYVFKKRFIWVGWIVNFEPSIASTLYYDNNATSVMNSPMVIYMTTALSKKSCLRKLEKFIERN